MSVLVWVNHEFETALNAVLLVFVNALEDRSNYIFYAIFTNIDNCVNHSMLNFLIINIYYSCFCVEDRLLTVLNNDSINYSFNESHIWISSNFCLTDRVHESSFKSELLLSLTEHLLLLLCDTLFIDLFFSSDSNLFLLYIFTTAILALALPSTRSEVVESLMSPLASNSNNSDTLVIVNDLNLTSITFCLVACCINNPNTVVANHVLCIGELTEFNCAASAWHLCSCKYSINLLLASYNLAFSALSNDRSELLVINDCINYRLLAFCTIGIGAIIGGSISSLIGMFLMASSLLSFKSDDRFYLSIDTDFSEEIFYSVSMLPHMSLMLPLMMYGYLLLGLRLSFFSLICCSIIILASSFFIVADDKSSCLLLSNTALSLNVLSYLMSMSLLLSGEGVSLCLLLLSLLMGLRSHDHPLLNLFYLTSYLHN